MHESGLLVFPISRRFSSPLNIGANVNAIAIVKDLSSTAKSPFFNGLHSSMPE